MTSGPVEKLDIGKVIQVSFALVRRYLPTFAILALLFSALPTFINALLQKELTATNTPAASGLASLITMIGSVIFQAASIQISVSDLNGRAIKLGDSLRLALKHMVPLVAIAILQSLAIVFGSILLLAPGIMMACAFAVAAPARVVENIPTLSTFRRSRDLTRGNRWRIFGLGMIYLIMVLVLEGVAFSLFGGFAGIVDPSSSPRLILLPIITMVIGTLSASTIGVLYFELRRIRDGVGAMDLATVFD